MQQNNSGNGWFETMQKAAEKEYIPDHTQSFEHGWIPKDVSINNSINSRGGIVVEVISTTSASLSFDDSLLATNESSSFTNANASLPSNLKIRSANLRLSSQISEVESRIEFGDWIFNHSDDSSAATPKAGSNAITESVCNEDDIVSSDTNGIDKESKPQYEMYFQLT